MMPELLARERLSLRRPCMSVPALPRKLAVATMRVFKRALAILLPGSGVLGVLVMPRLRVLVAAPNRLPRKLVTLAEGKQEPFLATPAPGNGLLAVGERVV